MSSEFMDEIREDVRREELVRIWKRYGHWLIIGTLALFTGTVAAIYWQSHREQQKIQRAHLYETALDLLDEGHKAEALEKLKTFAGQGDQGYTLLGLLKQVDQNEESIVHLQQIVDNPKIEASFRDLANLMIIQREVDQPGAGNAIQKLQPVVSSNSPWRSLANELLALAYLRTNRISDAQNIFVNILQDESATEGVRLRARAFLEYIRNN